MIPKIIHYCWFGGKEKPADVKQLIAQWHTLHPDYEIREWNESNFDVNQYAYTREAYATQNYAHVSDVARLYALYLHGGIYLDTDVEVVGSFDAFLRHRSFCCAEHKWLGTGVLGAQAQAYWVKLFLDYYASHHFITRWGHEKRTPNTKLFTLKIWPQIPPPSRQWSMKQTISVQKIGKQEPIVSPKTRSAFTITAARGIKSAKLGNNGFVSCFAA